MKIIAHAFGHIDDLGYTNSREAFEHYYARGVRWFEADVQKLACGEVVLFHDATHAGDRWLPRPVAEHSWEELRGFRYPNGAPVLSLVDAVELLASHPDIHMIFDTKRHPIRERGMRGYYALRKLNKWRMNVVEPGTPLEKGAAAFLDLMRVGRVYARNDDLHIYRKLLAMTRDRAILDRVAPQVHPENIQAVMDVYPFPSKIWKDTLKGRYRTDLAEARRWGCGMYARGYRRIHHRTIEGVAREAKEVGIELLLYSFPTPQALGELGIAGIGGGYIDRPEC